jgi:hypothetical protein
MKPARWITMIGIFLVAAAMPAGVASADPTGAANVPQILLGLTETTAPSAQRTFLTTDSIALTAVYYDPNPACAGAPPTFAHLFIFNLEGLFIAQVGAATSPPSSPFSSKYREVAVAFAPGSLDAGNYKFTFLVRSCDNTISVVLPELLTFRVISP